MIIYLDTDSFPIKSFRFSIKTFRFSTEKYDPVLWVKIYKNIVWRLLMVLMRVLWFINSWNVSRNVRKVIGATAISFGIRLWWDENIQFSREVTFLRTLSIVFTYRSAQFWPRNESRGRTNCHVNRVRIENNSHIRGKQSIFWSGNHPWSSQIKKVTYGWR